MAAKKNQVSDPCRIAAADKFQRCSPDAGPEPGPVGGADSDPAADPVDDDVRVVGFGVDSGFIGSLPVTQKANGLSVPRAANWRLP